MALEEEVPGVQVPGTFYYFVTLHRRCHPSQAHYPQYHRHHSAAAAQETKADPGRGGTGARQVFLILRLWTLLSLFPASVEKSFPGTITTPNATMKPEKQSIPYLHLYGWGKPFILFVGEQSIILARA